MNFVQGQTYKDREGAFYVFLHKNGNVCIFSDGTRKVCRHASGRYRWDEKQTNVDIVGEPSE